MGSADLVGGGGFFLGPLWISRTVLTTWGIMVVLGLASFVSTRRLTLDPGRWQTVLEGVIGEIEDAIREVLPDHVREVSPFIGTLWIFLVVANLTGLVPGLESPTADLSLTAALAVTVFLSVHYFGLRILGLRAYVRRYLRPSPVLLPFHLVGEVSRTLALAVRLFGNIMSLELAALLVLLIGGFLVTVPLLMLHIIEALVQAYIFGVLALIYIAGAIQAQEPRRATEQE